jgi:hypothetical protein
MINKYIFISIFFLCSCNQSQETDRNNFSYQNPSSDVAALAFGKDGKSIRLGDLEYGAVNCSEKNFYCLAAENKEFVLIIPTEPGVFCKYEVCASVIDVRQRYILGVSYSVATIETKVGGIKANYYLAEHIGIIGMAIFGQNSGGMLLSVSKKGFLSDFNFEKIRQIKDVRAATNVKDRDTQ